MADPEVVKTVLRCILTASPQEMTIDGLWREYKDSEGKEFPFAALGHRSFFDYLKSIPDILKLEQVPFGGTVVRLVASEKSAHIEKLVMAQKIPVPSKGRKRNTRRRRGAIAKLPDKKNFVVTKNIPSLMDIKNTAPSMSSSHSSSRALTPDTRHSDSSDIKSSVNQDMYASADDLAIRLDQVTYNDADIDPIGRRVFLKNGVEKTMDELADGIGFIKVNSSDRHVPLNNDVPGLNVFSSDCSNFWTSGITSPAGSEFVYNRIQVVQRCREFGVVEVHASTSQHHRIVNEIRHRNYEALVITIKIISHSYHGSESCNKIIIPDEVVNKLLDLLEKSCEGVRICDIGRRLVLSQKTIDRLYDLNINGIDDILKNLDDCVNVIGDRVFQKIVISSMSNGVNNVPYGSGYECSGSGSGRNSACSGSSNQCVINGTVLRNIRVILQENPRGVLCDNLPQMYYDKYRSLLDPTDFGFNSVLDMASQLQHQTNEFILKRDINRNAWVLTSLSDVEIPVSQSTDTDSPSCSLQTGFVINNFKKILMKYQPMTTSDLVLKFNMTYRRENGIQSLGYKSIDEFIDSKLKGMIEITKLKSTQLISLKSDFLCPTALPEDQEINDIMYSKDACQTDDKLPQFVITFSHNLPTKVEFVVSDVTSPDCFSMQLVSSYKVLDKLMTELYYFYEEHEANYPMCEETISIDMLCACTFAEPDDWHRARIMAVYSETVLLDYVDYGTTCNQPKSKLRLLHKRFSTLPVQSIGAQLRGIKPPGNTLQWSSDVKYKLLQMFENNIILAEVFSIDSKRSFLEVNLIQVGPEGKETLFSDILVSLGLAEYTDLPDGDKEELDNIQRTVQTKRGLRNKISTKRTTTRSESSNKYSTDEQNGATSNEFSQEQRESVQTSASRSADTSFDEFIDKTLEQLENYSLNEQEPPMKTNCSRPPPGFANINRTQNLFTTGYLIGLTQLQKAGSIMFNLDGVFNDSTPIIPNESVLLCQPLSECLVCRLVYTDKTVSPELLMPLVQHNLRHVQVFYNTLRQNLLIKMNPAVADMLSMFSNTANIASVLSSTPGAENLYVSPNVLPTFPVSQTINMVHTNNSLTGASAAVANNVLQSASHVNVSVADPTVPVVNNVHISNSLNTSVGPTNAFATSTNPRLLEISSDTESSAPIVLCSSNTPSKLTSVFGTQVDCMESKQNNDTVITSGIITNLSSKIKNSGSIIESQSENLNLKDVSKQCLLESVNAGGTMTSVYSLHNLQSDDGIDSLSHKLMSSGVDTVLDNKSVASTKPQISVASQSVGTQMWETSVPTNRHNMRIPSLDRSSQQRNIECTSPANLHSNGGLIETFKTSMCKNYGVAINESQPHTVDHQQEMSIPKKKQYSYSDYSEHNVFSSSLDISSQQKSSANQHSSERLENIKTEICKNYGTTINDFHPHTLGYQQEMSVPNILPINKEQFDYSYYGEPNMFSSSLDSSSQQRSTTCASPSNLHASGRLETVDTGIRKKYGVTTSECHCHTESYQQEISAVPSLSSVLQRKNSCVLENSHSSITSMESLSEMEDVSENTKTNENRYSTNHIPGHSSSKKPKVFRTYVGLTNAFATSTNPRLLETSRDTVYNTPWEPTNIIGSQVDHIEMKQSRDAIITSRIMTELSSNNKFNQ